MADLQVGMILDNKYRLISKLGKGGFGQVWLAEDFLLNMIVALKVIPSPLEDLVQNIQEAKIGHKFVHQNLIKIFNAEIVAFDDNSALTLIAEEYHKNGTVESLLNAHNFLDAQHLIKLLKEILLGLEHLHANGIYHNDIKPANILIDNNGRAILSDYGISGISIDGSPTKAQNAYILHEAPETIKSNNMIDVRTDLYQLGCTAYRLANGLSQLDMIRRCQTKEELYKNKINFDPKFSNSYIPEKLTGIIRKAMSPLNDKRYKSALDMRRDLEKLNFSGYWSDDPDDSNNMAGFDSKYIYRYKIMKRGKLYNIESTKQSLKSNSITHITKFWKKNLKKAELKKVEKKFINAVINGNV